MILSTEQEKLALEIATKLNDLGALQLHRKFVITYSERYLRKQLEKALSVPEHKIRVSRGALYTSLVKSNAIYSRD